MSMDRTNAEYHGPLTYRNGEDSPVPELDSYLPFGLRRDDGSPQDPDNRFRVCGNNPVNIIDPDGKSWYFNSETGEFVSHIEDDNDYVYLITPEQIDKVNNGDKELQSYSEWSINNNSIYSPYFNVLEGGTTIADALKGQLNKINIGNNSKWYFEQNSGRIFNGNQYVTTTPATIKYSNLIKGTTIVGGIVTIASSSYDIYQGFVQDGGRYGYNAQVQTAGVIGGFAGGIVGAELGAKIGAGIGAFFGGVGAVPGGIIGSVIGGALGAFGGDYYGEKAAKELFK